MHMHYYDPDPPWTPPATTVVIFVAVLVACVLILSWLLWQAGLFAGSGPGGWGTAHCNGDGLEEGEHSIEGTLWVTKKPAPPSRAEQNPQHSFREHATVIDNLDTLSSNVTALGVEGFRPCWHLGRPLNTAEAGRVMMETLSVSEFLSARTRACQPGHMA